MARVLHVRDRLSLNGWTRRGNVQMRMRLIPLLVTATLAAAPAFAAQGERPAQATAGHQESTANEQKAAAKKQPSKSENRDAAAPLDLPVSLDKIRAALEQPVA